jgi:hypothetical protein
VNGENHNDAFNQTKKRIDVVQSIGDVTFFQLRELAIKAAPCPISQDRKSGKIRERTETDEQH